MGPERRWSQSGNLTGVRGSAWGGGESPRREGSSVALPRAGGRGVATREGALLSHPGHGPRAGPGRRPAGVAAFGGGGGGGGRRAQAAVRVRLAPETRSDESAGGVSEILD